MNGTWKTWHLAIDHEVPGIEGLTLLRCVSTANPAAQHPSGSLSPVERASSGQLLMVASTGRIYRMPTGDAVLARLVAAAEWQACVAEWESRA